MNNSAIGIFDSGLGGLTAVKALTEIMPYENLIYFGDTKRTPYGNKDKGTLLQYAKQNIRFLKSLGVKVILAACGTISSYVSLIESDLDVFGVIESTCQTAVNLTKNRRIGILGTQAAIKSNAYGKYISELENDILCYSQACPLLVPMIENGFTTSENGVLKTVLGFYISPLVEKEVDTIILGCTHYPIVEQAIRDIFGNGLSLVNPGKESAESLKVFLKSKGLDSDAQRIGNQKFYVSGDKEKFSKNAYLFLKKDISDELMTVEIEDF